MQSTQNRKFVKFLQYNKEKLPTAFVFYWDAKHSDSLRGSSHVSCYFFWVVVVKNGRGIFNHGNLKSAVSEE